MGVRRSSFEESHFCLIALLASLNSLEVKLPGPSFGDWVRWRRANLPKGLAILVGPPSSCPHTSEHADPEGGLAIGQVSCILMSVDIPARLIRTASITPPSEVGKDRPGTLGVLKLVGAGGGGLH